MFFPQTKTMIIPCFFKTMIIPSSVFVCSLFAMVSGFIANSMLHVNDVCLVLRSILHLSILKKQDIFGRVVLKNTITSEQKYINICHNMNQPKKHQRMTSVQQKSFQIHQQKVCLQVVIFFPSLHFCWGTLAFLWPAVVAAVLALEKAAAVTKAAAVAVAAAQAKLNLHKTRREGR